MTPEQEKALALARARKRKAEAGGALPQEVKDRIAAAKAGTLKEADPARQAEIDAMAMGAPEGNGFFSGVADTGKAALAGLVRGGAGVVGLPGTIGDLIDTGVTKGINAIAGTDLEAPKSNLSGGALIGGLSSLTGGATDYRGEGLPAKFAGTVAEFLPGAAAFGGGSAANLLRFGVVPGLASEAAGQLTEGSKFEPWARAGAALAAPLVAGGLSSLARKAISPYGGADPERLALAQTLDDAGIPVTAGQRVGSEALRRKEGLTQAGQDLMETQGEAFTRAALKTAGTDAPRATPEVLKQTADRIGQVFDDVTQGLDIAPSTATAEAIKAADDTYKALAPTSGQSPMIGQVADEIAKAAADGSTIPAATVKVWRSRLSKLTTSADDATRTAAREALEVVDDAFSEALTAAGRADDIAKLAEARTQWRNFLAIQKAASGAGEGAAAGVLSPSALRSAVATQGRAAYAQGQRGDLGELVRAAEGVIKKLPTSGTAENLRAMLPASLWSALGGGLGATTQNPYAVMAGAAVGAMVPNALGAVRMSAPVQAYLANQLAGAPTRVFTPNALSPMVPFLSGERNALGMPR